MVGADPHGGTARLDALATPARPRRAGVAPRGLGARAGSRFAGRAPAQGLGEVCQRARVQGATETGEHRRELLPAATRRQVNSRYMRFTPLLFSAVVANLP